MKNRVINKGLLVLVAMGLLISLGSINVAADTWTQTTQEDFESGTLENLDTTRCLGGMKLAQTATTLIDDLRSISASPFM